MAGRVEVTGVMHWDVTYLVIVNRCVGVFCEKLYETKEVVIP